MAGSRLVNGRRWDNKAIATNYQTSGIFSWNKVSTAKRSAIVRALCERCSIRATVHMTGASKNTIVKLLVEVGEACSKYQDEHLRGVCSRRV